MNAQGIRRVRNLSFVFLFLTAFITLGEPLRASLSSSDSVYDSYSSMLGSGACHKSGNGWSGVYYCTFPENEFPDDPYTQGSYFGDQMYGACSDDADAAKAAVAQQYNLPTWCLIPMADFSTGMQYPEQWASCDVWVYSFCDM